MSLENLENVANLCAEFNRALADAYPAQNSQVMGNKLYKHGLHELMQTLPDVPDNQANAKLISFIEMKAELFTHVLSQAEMAKHIPAALKEPENIETLRQVGTTLAALCTLKP